MSDPEVEVSVLSPKEAAWWTEDRESAYQLVLSGAPLHHVAAQLHIGVRTLYAWRNHDYWLQRVLVDREVIADLHEDQLLGLDMAALLALHGHLNKSGPVALEYLHRRGVLRRHTPRTSADDAADETIVTRWERDYDPAPDLGPARPLVALPEEAPA